jgi:type IV pilus assembly protein PilF
MKTKLPGIAVLLLSGVLTACSFGQSQPDDLTPEKHADIYIQLGVGHMKEGKLETALAKLNRAIEINPNDPNAYNVRGLVFNRIGDNAKAEENFKRALSLSPDDPGILNNYGQFLCQVERGKEAEPLFDKAMNNPLYETPEIAQTNAGVCAAHAGNAEKAEVYFRKALNSNGEMATALLEMADLNLQKGQFIPARGYYQRYSAVAEQTARSLWIGIQIERKLGDKDALASYSVALKGKFPDSDEAKKLLDSETRP